MILLQKKTNKQIKIINNENRFTFNFLFQYKLNMSIFDTFNQILENDLFIFSLRISFDIHQDIVLHD